MDDDVGLVRRYRARDGHIQLLEGKARIVEVRQARPGLGLVSAKRDDVAGKRSGIGKLEQGVDEAGAHHAGRARDHDARAVQRRKVHAGYRAVKVFLVKLGFEPRRHASSFEPIAGSVSRTSRLRWRRPTT